MDLAKLQEQLLKQRDALLRDLGIGGEDDRAGWSNALSAAARVNVEDSRKRKAQQLAQQAAASTSDIGERRSLRVRGIASGGALPAGGAELKRLDDASSEHRERPVGDVAWHATLKYASTSSEMATGVFNAVRSATAALLSLPAPPPVSLPLLGRPAAAGDTSAAAVDAPFIAGAASAAPASSLLRSAAKGGLANAEDYVSAAEDGPASPQGARRIRSEIQAEEGSVGSRTRRAQASLLAASPGTGAAAAAPRAAASSGSASSAPAAAVVGGNGAAAAAAAVPAVALGAPDGGLTARVDLNAGYALPLPCVGAPAAPAVGAASGAASTGASSSSRRAGAGALSPARSSSAATAAATADGSSLAGLQLRHVSAVLKVVPDRIYSVAMHPARDCVLGIAGSKSGFVAVWQPDMERLLPSSAAAASTKSTSGGDTGGGGGGSGRAKRSRRDDAGPDDDEGGGGGGGRSAPPAGECEGGHGGDAMAVHDAAVPAFKTTASGFKRKGPVSDARDEEVDGADEGAPNDKVAIFAPHTAPVNYLSVPRGSPHLLMTASFDGSVRALDFNRGVSAEWLSDGRERGGISAIDIFDGAVAGAADIGGGSSSRSGTRVDDTQAGFLSRAAVVGTYDGHVGFLDLRARSLVHVFAPHARKVTAVSTCGASYFLSASSDSTVHLWDARKLSAGKKGGTAPAATVGSTQAVTSSFFSPLGTRIVATCNDNKLRVWTADWRSSGACVRWVHTATALSRTQLCMRPLPRSVCVLYRARYVYFFFSTQRAPLFASPLYSSACASLSCSLSLSVSAQCRLCVRTLLSRTIPRLGAGSRRFARFSTPATTASSLRDQWSAVSTSTLPQRASA